MTIGIILCLYVGIICADHFLAGEGGSVLKKLDHKEHDRLLEIQCDSLCRYLPQYRGVVEKNGQSILPAITFF